MTWNVAGSDPSDFVAGIGRSRGRMVILLNLDQVLRFDVRRRGDRAAVEAKRNAAERGGEPGWR